MFRHAVSVLSRVHSSLRSLDDSKYIHIISSCSQHPDIVHNTATRSRKRYLQMLFGNETPLSSLLQRRPALPPSLGPTAMPYISKRSLARTPRFPAWRLVCLPCHYCCCVRQIFQRARRRTRALRQESSGRVRGDEGKGLRRHTRRRVESQERGLRRRGQHRHREDREDRQERFPKISRTEKS